MEKMIMPVEKPPEAEDWKLKRDQRMKNRAGILAAMLDALSRPKPLIGNVPSRKREDPKTKKRRKMSEKSRRINRH